MQNEMGTRVGGKQPLDPKPLDPTTTPKPLGLHLDQLGFHFLSTPTPPVEGWGRQKVETDLYHIGTGVARDATSIGNFRCS